MTRHSASSTHGRHSRAISGRQTMLFPASPSTGRHTQPGGQSWSHRSEQRPPASVGMHHPAAQSASLMHGSPNCLVVPASASRRRRPSGSRSPPLTASESLSDESSPAAGRPLPEHPATRADPSAAANRHPAARTRQCTMESSIGNTGRIALSSFSFKQSRRSEYRNGGRKFDGRRNRCTLNCFECSRKGPRTRGRST